MPTKTFRHKSSPRMQVISGIDRRTGKFIEPRYEKGHEREGRCVEHLTENSHMAEVSLKNIIKKYGIEKVSRKIDFMDGPVNDYTGLDYHMMLNRISEVRQGFDELPAALRKHFDNSPEQLLDFVQNPENASQAEEIGLGHLFASTEEPREPQAPPEEPPVEPPAE